MTCCFRSVSGSRATNCTTSASTARFSGLATSFSSGSKMGASFTSCTVTTTVAVAVGSEVANGTSFSTAIKRVCVRLFSKSRPWLIKEKQQNTTLPNYNATLKQVFTERNRALLLIELQKIVWVLGLLHTFSMESIPSCLLVPVLTEKCLPGSPLTIWNLAFQAGECGSSPSVTDIVRIWMSALFSSAEASYWEKWQKAR